MARRFGQKYSKMRIRVENRTKVFENQNSWRESEKTIRELEFMSRISNRSIRESEFMARISNKSFVRYSRHEFWFSNSFVTKLFENQNSWRESDKTIRESEFMARIGQNYSRIRIHVENRTKLFENQNSWRELEKSIRESKFMARIEQKYSRIRIHVENRTKLFEDQNTKNATCAARLEIQNGGIGKHQCKPRCSRISTFFG